MYNMKLQSIPVSISYNVLHKKQLFHIGTIIEIDQ